jgi:hypothetical protein
MTPSENNESVGKKVNGTSVEKKKKDKNAPKKEP